MIATVDADTRQAHHDMLGCSWDGRRVAVVGLGRSGQAAAQWLTRQGCRVAVTDLRDSPEAQAAAEQMRSLGIERVEVGGHTRAFIDQADAVVVSPGVPEHAEPIRWTLERGVPIFSEIELAFRFCTSPIVAVTGTNGKSTAVTLIAEILRAAGRPAIACGNLGIPFSSVLEQLHPQTVAVVEVSSFQLLWCDQFRPKIGVLLNLGTNHLDRHQDASAYFAAKARLFQRQTPEDWAVLNGRDPRIVALAGQVHARQVWFADNRTNPTALRLAPETQRALTDGAQAALQIARLLGVADPLAWQVMRGFRGLEHRLEHVATIGGIRYINDSKSTTPDSLRYALEQTRGPVVPIIGGRDKGVAFDSLVDPLHESRIKGVVLIGESRSRLRALLNGSTAVAECETLEQAVRASERFAGPGSTVLFSPACASFDMFKNFEERGRAFKEIVQHLGHAPRPNGERLSGA